MTHYRARVTPIQIESSVERAEVALPMDTLVDLAELFCTFLSRSKVRGFGQLLFFARSLLDNLCLGDLPLSCLFLFAY